MLNFGAIFLSNQTLMNGFLVYLFGLLVFVLDSNRCVGFL